MRRPRVSPELGSRWWYFRHRVTVVGLYPNLPMIVTVEFEGGTRKDVNIADLVGRRDWAT